MTGTAVALRLDDVGAASKAHEVYGLTRVPLGSWSLPFPGNALFLKYVPPIKRWGPYPELAAADWESIAEMLQASSARMTVAVTAGWVERDGRVVPYPDKFPAAARALRDCARRGLVEIAHHGYTHCVLEGRRYLPHPWKGNRTYHREFHDWVPAATHREHVRRAQGILQDFFGVPVVTFVPPGNVFTRTTLESAAAVGLRYLSCTNADRVGETAGLTAIPDQAVLALHDRDVVVRGRPWLAGVLHERAGALTTIADVAARLEQARR
jgi:peptidoglycan/xylan/chitin deacetylase (PgdA/CDA1 family)